MNIDTQNNIVEITHKTDLLDGKQQTITTIFDFSKVTHEQLLEMATKNRVIASRAKWRQLTKDDVNGTSIDVAQQLTATRTKKTNMEKVDSLVKDMSEEEIAALISKYSK